MNTKILRIAYECHFRILKVKLIFVFVILFITYRFLNSIKSSTNIMNLIQSGTAGYINTVGVVVMYTLSFEYHIIIIGNIVIIVVS